MRESEDESERNVSGEKRNDSVRGRIARVASGHEVSGDPRSAPPQMAYPGNASLRPREVRSWWRISGWKVDVG